MDDKIHKQFMLESSIIHDSCKFATDNAIKVNEKYERMSPEDLYFYGPEILKELESEYPITKKLLFLLNLI